MSLVPSNAIEIYSSADHHLQHPGHSPMDYGRGEDAEAVAEGQIRAGRRHRQVGYGDRRSAGHCFVR